MANATKPTIPFRPFIAAESKLRELTPIPLIFWHIAWHRIWRVVVVPRAENGLDRQRLHSGCSDFHYDLSLALQIRNEERDDSGK